jgi:hypothetical protein
MKFLEEQLCEVAIVPAERGIHEPYWPGPAIRLNRFK